MKTQKTLKNLPANSSTAHLRWDRAQSFSQLRAVHQLGRVRHQAQAYLHRSVAWQLLGCLR